MSDWMMKTIRAEARRLLELAAVDGELRTDLRTLAEEILAATVDPSTVMSASASGREMHLQQTTSTPAPQIAAILSEESRPILPPEQNLAAESLRELTLGRSRATTSGEPIESGQPAQTRIAEEDLASLEARCRRKAEAARWVAETQRRVRESGECQDASDPLNEEVAAWAGKLADGFYWMCSKQVSSSAEISILDDISGCFDTLAEGLALVQERQGQGKTIDQALEYLAEAQSAVRRGLQALDIAPDPDQVDTYEWIRATAARERVYLGRHMRADDLADPARWSSLLTRIEEARCGHKSPLQVSLLDRIRHHAQRIKQGSQGEEDWPLIQETVVGLIGDGMPPSNRELREILVPIIDDAADREDPPRVFRLVLREIDRYLASRLLPVASSFRHEQSAEVEEVARLLSGKSVVLIGGIRRRESQRMLRKLFGLNSLYWIETKEHQSVESFKPMIARFDVALVLLAVRWSSHGFGDARQLCERYHKPFVRLPGGYGPNQVAAQILAQVSEQLRAARN
jgi:hypothetical protein